MLHPLFKGALVLLWEYIACGVLSIKHSCVDVWSARVIGQLHVNIGILMKFFINVTSRLGSLVARKNVLKYMEKS